MHRRPAPQRSTAGLQGVRRSFVASPPHWSAPNRSSVARRAADTQLTEGLASAAGQDTLATDGTSKCPFLAALPSPPSSTYPWFNRLQQLFKPEEYQAATLRGRRVVAVPKQLGMTDMFVIGSAEGIKKVFGGEAEGNTTVTNRQRIVGRGLLGTQNLLAVPEPRHSYLRKLIMPAFTNEAIAVLVPRMEAVLSTYLSRWAAAGRVKAHEELRRMTFEFIIAVVLGRDYPASDVARLSQLYGTWAKGLMAWPFIDLPFTSFGRALVARWELLDWFQGAVDEARQQAAAGQAVPGILGSLVTAVDEQGNRLTDDELTDNLLLLLLAGHDTSSTSLTNALALLQDNPGAIEQLRQEQQQLVAKYGPRLDGSVLKEMVYAEAVIRETLRLRNVVSGLFRSAGQDFELEGYKVPQGTMLYLALSNAALSDPRWVDDEPAAFKPERMLTPEGLRQGSLLPFGYGPRFCAGYAVAMAEMKVFLALLVRGYEFDVDNNTEWVQEIGKKPVNGLPMTITRRG